MSYKETREKLGILSCNIASDVFDKYGKSGGYDKLYLYGQPAPMDGYPNRIIPYAEVAPIHESDILICAEHFPRNLQYNQLSTWISEKLNSAPILPIQQPS